MGEEVLVYDLLADKAFCLNKTSAMIWNLCDGENSISRISEILSERLKTKIGEDFVMLAISRLQDDNLLERKIKIPAEFGKSSRREIIKRIGLGTMAALPAVLAITAPKAVQAASVCLVSGSACTSSAQCCATNTTTVTASDGTVYTFTGACCRTGTSTNAPYGGNNTCVPAPTSGATIPAGVVGYNGNTTTGGPVTCR